MKSHEQIDAETQAIVATMPEIERAWHLRKECRLAEHLGLTALNGIANYRGFTKSCLRGLEIDDE